MIGQFDSGDSAAGASDMSGNVWEWTNSWYDAERVYRSSVRGGSWDIHRDSCAVRFVTGTSPTTSTTFSVFGSSLLAA